MVAYNNYDDLVIRIREIENYPEDIIWELIIVDNNSSDQTNSLHRINSEKIHWIINKKNIGFAAAVNQAANLASGAFLLLLNPDSSISADGLKILRDYLNRNNNCAVAAPRIEYPDHCLQPSRGSFPTLFLSLIHLSQIKKIMPSDEKVMSGPFKILGRLFKQYSVPEAVQTVDYSTGACVLIRRTIWDDLNGLDERFFLYYEEIDFGYRLRERGKRWVFLDSARCEHTVAAASSQAPLRPFMERYRSLLLYYLKHRSRSESAGIFLMIAMMSVIRMILAGINSKFRIDPANNWCLESRLYYKLLFLWREL